MWATNGKNTSRRKFQEEYKQGESTSDCEVGHTKKANDLIKPLKVEGERGMGRDKSPLLHIPLRGPHEEDLANIPEQRDKERTQFR